jgi:hypothetical protein
MLLTKSLSPFENRSNPRKVGINQWSMTGDPQVLIKKDWPLAVQHPSYMLGKGQKIRSWGVWITELGWLKAWFLMRCLVA